ncbi:DNA-deoxyinosine glycosylase [Amnimonas aquatica]|uniref:DNA-deoxyinosine glycosylase n=1 Tax=Amnimonas aquatica TaxID=2094561 RepID=A0A2P6AQ83_9GAMM|nr:DNA-deoxyinosine glycosylase [Amnimonas aquatica]PQA27962.1 DNA-deoxyinosine glycosylase [Amnimonas aquatica]
MPATPVVRSFAAVENPAARVLILGSMPGVASLTAGEYYAHPRNAFWHIMAELAGADPALAYAERLARLRAAGIALWDVLASCERPGSLDADIVAPSVVVNDFAGFLRRHPEIDRIGFNGATAAQCFRRHALPGLREAGLADALALHTLPSTSPAHAGMPYARKLALWSAFLRGDYTEAARAT